MAVTLGLKPDEPWSEDVTPCLAKLLHRSLKVESRLFKFICGSREDYVQSSGHFHWCHYLGNAALIRSSKAALQSRGEAHQPLILS